MTQSSTPGSKSFPEPIAANPSTPSLYRFGPNRHQLGQNAFTRIRTPERSFTISCPAGSFARAAKVPEAESVRFDPRFDSKPVLAVGTEARLRADGREEGESEGGESEESEIRVGREEVDGRGERTRRGRRASAVEGKVERGGWKRGGRGGCKATEEEEEAVAVIAGVLKGKFGPQIVREEGEEEGSTNGSITDEEAKGAEGEEKVDGNAEAEGAEFEGEEDEEGNEGEDAAAEAEEEASDEDGQPTTSPPTPPPPLNSPRVVSPSSLLSLYRFFSSHLGITSPSTVASVLASRPALMRSDPASDLLPRVHLLQSYGVSRADMSAITMNNASWFRCSLAQVREMLDFLLARGVRRTKLGMVLRKSRYLMTMRLRSANLDILVERAGVPVDKLGVIIERGPTILCLREETIQRRLEQVSTFFTNGYGEESINSGHLRQHLNRQHKDDLSKVLVFFPKILLRPPERIATNLRHLQSFTPPGSPSVAIPVLRQAPTLLSQSSQNILSKLQYLEKLVGKKVAGTVLRSHAAVLILSLENMQGKVALLGDLIGRENAVLAVARYPSMLASNGESLKRGFSELVREVEEALEGGEDEGYARESPYVEEPQIDAKDARERAEQGGRALPKNGGERREGRYLEGVGSDRSGEGKEEHMELEYGEEDGEMDELGVRKVEYQSVLDSMQDSYDVLGRKGAAGRRGVNQQQGWEVACLTQLLGRTDKEFEKRFKAESANPRFDPSFDGKTVLTVETDARLRADGKEKGEREGGESEESESRVGREEADGRGERTRRDRRARKVKGKVEGDRRKRGGRGGCEVTEEEKKAVAVIAGVLREKFGPQIVIEEEEEGGAANGRITDEEEAKGRQEEEEVGYGDEEIEGSEVEEEEDEEWKEGEDAEAEAGASDEDGTPATSPPTPPSLLKRRRAVSPSSLLSLYRFFSSHLGISSPSTVASLLASYPALLRSDSTNDLLPRVELLESYGISRADISTITMSNPFWLRVSLPQSFTPPDSPSIAIRVLRQAPSLVHLSSQNILAKLQYLEELVGKKAAACVVRSHPTVLLLSIENMQGKVALLGDLIGRENTVLAVARFPVLLASNEENIKKGFRELVREVEEAMEESRGEESGRHLLEEGARKLVHEVGEALEGGEGDGVARESPAFEACQKDARERAEQGGSDAGCQSGVEAWAEEDSEEGSGSTSIAATTTACELVVKLVVTFPNSICYSWERNTRHKVEYLKRDMGLSIKEVLAFPHFLGYSLERRIRPRHVALVSRGFVLVPHEEALPKNGAGRWHLEGISNGRSGAEGKGAAGEDVGGKDEVGVRKHEDRTALEYAQDSYAALGGGGAVAVNALSQRGEGWRQGGKAVCLTQFLACTGEEFEKKFQVELAPFMLEAHP
ncbi:unnamed protein product [Closterium sp. Naga37s-1]|nr:unnamed protein product [Closterium sp. Naga37s-1]